MVVLPALLVPSLVERGVGRLAEELDVLGLLLADHDRMLEVHVQDRDELLVTRLEEQVLDVAEEDVCWWRSRSSVVGGERGRRGEETNRSFGPT